MGNPSPVYLAEFKPRTVELHGKSGTTHAEVARELGCELGCGAGGLADWAKKADAAGPAPGAASRVSAPSGPSARDALPGGAPDDLADGLQHHGRAGPRGRFRCVRPARPVPGLPVDVSCSTYIDEGEVAFPMAGALV